MLLNIFGETVKQFTYRDAQIFCNIINVFTVTFDNFNGLLLNKSIHFTKIILQTFNLLYRLLNSAV